MQVGKLGREASATSDEAPATSDEAAATSDEASATSDEASATSDEATATSDEAPAAYIYLFFKPYPWPVAHRPLAPNQMRVSASIP